MQNTRNASQGQPGARRLTLAYVEDAHNVGCFVRLEGESALRRAHYSRAIQEGGVVIRTGHVVAVDEGSDPPEVVWRLGTRGTVLRVDSGELMLDLGYAGHRQLTIPLRDERPEEERTVPLAAGGTVLLHGSPIEDARVTDVFAGGEVAHPERLREQVARVSERRAGH